MSIKFGTDGWRGIIAEDFTFDNVGRVAQATALYFKPHPKISSGIVVGYDARFLSREFAEKTAEVLGNSGIKVKLANSIVTTPMVSLAVKKLNAAGGVVITASHNPAKYNGFKIKGDFGGPAHPEQIKKVEAELKKILTKRDGIKQKKSLEELADSGIVEYIGLKKMYIDEVKKKVDLHAIEAAKLKILYDAMHGAGQGVMELLLPSVGRMRDTFNPSFGGVHPEPLAQNLTELSKTVREEHCDIGLATDGDADRVGIMDERGAFVDSHQMFALLLKYFVEEKGLRGEIAKSFSVSEMIDKMCEKYGLKLHITPIGFKYLCRLMTERDVLIAAEESGGLGVRDHVPERDGILVGLMICEIMVRRKKKLSQLVQELMEEFGRHYCKRVDLRITEQEKERIMAKYKKGMNTIGGLKIVEVKNLDGYKFYVDGGWLLVRASGTEPLIRFYAEADSLRKADQLLEAATRV